MKAKTKAKGSKTRGSILEMDPTLVSKSGGDHNAPLPDRGGKDGPDAAARRAGRPTNAAEIPDPLPFDSTLMFAFRRAGGREGAVACARLAAQNDTRFLRWVTAYDKLSESDRRAIRLEDLCTVAEISASDFLGGAVSAAHRFNMDVSRLTVSMNHHRLVDAAVESAASPFGEGDRKMLFTQSGFLPQGKGQTVNVPIQINQGSVSGPTTISAGQNIPQLPRFESDVKDISEIIRGDAGVGKLTSGQKQLSAPETVEIVDAEVVD